MQTITQVANELGVKHWNIRHAIDGGYIDKPTCFSGRFIFTEEDKQTLTNYFSQTRKKANDVTNLEDLFAG